MTCRDAIAARAATGDYAQINSLEEILPEAKWVLRKNPQGIHSPRFFPSGHHQPGTPIPTVTPPAGISIQSHDPIAVNSPASCSTCEGTTYSGWFPPDTHGAVGLNEIINVANGQIRIQSKANCTDLITPLDLTLFFKLNILVQDFVFDPTVFYDSFQNRWFITANADITTATNSSTLLATSQTGNPLGAWTFYRFDADPANSQVADRQRAGFNNRWIVITNNMFGTPTGLQVIVLDKLLAYAGGPLAPCIINSTAVGFDHQPYTDYDNTDPNMVLLQANTAGLNKWEITGTLPCPSINYNFAGFYPSSLGVWPFILLTAPQAGAAQPLEAGVPTINSCVLRNGRLWAAHTIASTTGPLRAIAQWWQLDRSSTTVLQQGRVDDPTAQSHFIYPSIAANRNDDALLGFTRTGPSQFASAAYAIRNSGDLAGTMQGDIVYQPGLDTYVLVSPLDTARNRWGDYSQTVVDPSNDCDMWTMQEYAALRANPVNYRWGTRMAKVCVNCATATPTATASPSGTASGSPSPSPTFSYSPTVTSTPTRTPSPSATLFVTATPSPTISATSSNSPTNSPSPSVTATHSFSPTRTETSTSSPTSSATMTHTFSPTRSPSPPATPTRSATPFISPTSSATPCLVITAVPSGHYTGSTLIDACAPASSAFFATNDNGQIVAITTGSSSFFGPGYSATPVFSQSEPLNAISSACCGIPSDHSVAWAVGNNQTAFFNDGTSPGAWSSVAVSSFPSSPDLLAVDVSDCNEVWISGVRGLILHHPAGLPPASGWELVNPPVGTRLPEQDMKAIRKIPARTFPGLGCSHPDWVLVAGKHAAGDNQSVYLSTNVNAPNPTFTPVVLPANLPPNTDMTAISLVSDGSVYVIGSNGVILHGLVNSTCSGFDFFLMSGIVTTENLTAIFVDDINDITVVGDNGTILSWNGVEWVEVNSGGAQPFGTVICFELLGEEVCGILCDGYITVVCPEGGTTVPDPTLSFTSTHSATFSGTPTHTPSRTPASGSATSSRTPAVATLTGTPTATPSSTGGAGGGTHTATPGFGGTPLSTPTPTPGVGGGGTSTSTPAIGVGSPTPTFTNSPTPSGGGGTPATFTPVVPFGTLTATPTFTPPSLPDWNAICCTNCGGDESVWVVGDDGAIGHYENGVLTRFDINTTEDFLGVECFPDYVIVSGDLGSVYIGRAVGSSCTDFVFAPQPSAPAGYSLNSIVGDQLGANLYAVGTNGGGFGVLLQSAFTLVPPSSGPWLDISAAKLPSITGPALNKILEGHPNEFWIVGDAGTVLNSPNISSSPFVQAPLPATVSVLVGMTFVSVSTSSIDFKAIAVDPSDLNKIYVSGTQGVILYSVDGGLAWTQIVNGFNSQTLRGIAVLGTNQIVFVGNGGTILSWDGFTLTSRSLEFGFNNLSGICGQFICADDGFFMEIPFPTPTPTATSSSTQTLSFTSTGTWTPSPTNSGTATPTIDLTPGKRPSFPPGQEKKFTATPTFTGTATPSATWTSTPTQAPTVCPGGSGLIERVAGQVASGESGCPEVGLLGIDSVLLSVEHVSADGAGNLSLPSVGCDKVYLLDDATQKIVLLAGTGIKGSGGDGGPAVSAQLDRPFASDFDKFNNLYILETPSSLPARIRRIDGATGIISTLVASLPAAGRDLAVSPDGTKLYVPHNAGIHSVQLTGAGTGTVTLFAGNGSFGSANDGDPALGSPVSPTFGIGVDSAGNVFYIDSATPRIRRIDINTGLISTVAGTLSSGFGGDGLAATAPGVMLSGNITGLALDRANNIYIADAGNSRIRRVDAVSAIISTDAGTGSTDYSGDGGTALTAGMDSLMQVSAHPSGDYLVNHFGRHVIRRIYVCGVIPPIPAQFCSGRSSNLRNGGFDEPPSPSNPPLRWANVESGLAAEQIPAFDRKGISFPHGVWQVQYSGSSGDSASISQTVSGLPVGTYNVSGYLLRENVLLADSLHSTVTLSGFGGPDMAFVVSPSQAEFWTFFSQSVMVSTGQISIRLRTQAGANSGPPELWDDIRLCADTLGATTITPTPTPEPIPTQDCLAFNNSPQWEALGEGGGFGFTGAFADVNGDGFDDVIIGAANFNVNRGRVYVYYASSTGLPSVPNLVISGVNSGERLGNAIAAAGDVNNDGYGDIIIAGQDQVSVHLGGAGGLSSVPNWQPFPPLSLNVANVHTAGRSNGDLFDDILVSDSSAGVVYLFHGSPAGPSLVPNTVLTPVPGSQNPFRYGEGLASADLNGDGFTDAVIGHPRSINPFGNQGAVLAYLGSVGGLATTACSMIVGPETFDEFGSRGLGAAGDINSDTFEDIVVGKGPSGNKAFIYHGSSGPACLSASPVLTLLPPPLSNGFGFRAGPAGDVNGDGLKDIYVTGRVVGTNMGKVHVYLGDGSAEGVEISPAWTVEGDVSSDSFGNLVAAAAVGGGDFNNDGLDDLVVGAGTAAGGLGKAFAFLGNCVPVGGPLMPLGGEATAAKVGDSGRGTKRSVLPAGKKLLVGPNPAKSDARIFFKVDAASALRFVIVNTAGEVVMNENLPSQAVGEWSHPLSFNSLAPGVYLVVYLADEGFGFKTKATFKLAVVK